MFLGLKFFAFVISELWYFFAQEGGYKFSLINFRFKKNITTHEGEKLKNEKYRFTKHQHNTLFVVVFLKRHFLEVNYSRSVTVTPDTVLTGS